MSNFCRDIRPQSRGDYGVQVQLRFCLLETSCDQEDNFPPSICVRINGKMATLPVSSAYVPFCRINNCVPCSRSFQVSILVMHIAKRLLASNKQRNLSCRIRFQPISQVWNQNDLVDQSILLRFAGSHLQCPIM